MQKKIYTNVVAKITPYLAHSTAVRNLIKVMKTEMGLSLGVEVYNRGSISEKFKILQNR